jgi:hypothetical protein
LALKPRSVPSFSNSRYFFHVGGINLFDRPAQAVREMVRAARPGALILVADESPGVVRDHYQARNPFTRAATRGIATDLDLRAWVPADVRELSFREVWEGKGYFLWFRAPG